MFARNRGQNDVDEMFGLLTRRMDRIEYDVVPTLQGRFESMNNAIQHVSILDNRISVLQAKTQSLIERANRHLPPLGAPQGSVAGSQPQTQETAAGAQPGPSQAPSPAAAAQGNVAELLGLTADMAEGAPFFTEEGSETWTPAHLGISRMNYLERQLGEAASNSQGSCRWCCP